MIIISSTLHVACNTEHSRLYFKQRELESLDKPELRVISQGGARRAQVCTVE